MVLRWLTEPNKLSRDQLRVIRESVRRGVPLALSTITFTELAVILGTKLRAPLIEILSAVSSEADFRSLPTDATIAAEIAALGDSLRDPADRTIVATARVHRLRLVTSDQRIIQSGLANTVE